jgi:hypothetical protein
MYQDPQGVLRAKKFVVRNASVMGVAILVALGGAIGGALTSWFRGEVLPDRGQPLVANTWWPLVRPCDGGTLVALPSDIYPSVELDALHIEPRDTGSDGWQADPQGDALKAGAFAYGSGTLTVLLTTHDESSSVVTNIEPVVFSSRPAEPAWVIDIASGCGGEVNDLLYLLDFDDYPPRVIEDPLSAYNLETYATDENPAEHRETFGPSFFVSNDDPARLVISAKARCGQQIEWGLIVEYIHQGEPKTLEVGGPDEPFGLLEGPGPRYIPQYLNGGSIDYDLMDSNFRSWDCDPSQR